MKIYSNMKPGKEHHVSTKTLILKSEDASSLVQGYTIPEEGVPVIVRRRGCTMHLPNTSLEETEKVGLLIPVTVVMRKFLLTFSLIYLKWVFDLFSCMALILNWNHEISFLGNTLVCWKFILMYKIIKWCVNWLQWYIIHPLYLQYSIINPVSRYIYHCICGRHCIHGFGPALPYLNY